MQPTPLLELAADQQNVDLGRYDSRISLATDCPESAKANGTCFDYEKHYGEPPPDWHISEARGISKDAKISELRGKWVLFTFWGMSCWVCYAKNCRS